MAPENIVIAFDLYGTLLSTESIAHELAKIFGDDKSQSIAALWRRYQLEYTWRSNSSGEYKSFSEITRSSLGHALAEHGLDASPEQANLLMMAYDALHAFPEVPAALGLLREREGSVDAYIFSNGTDDMVGNSIKTSPELGPHGAFFKAMVTVDSIRAFKPSPRVYEHLVSTAHKLGSEGDVWVVSANPFDIVGSKVAGLKAAFIDRAGKGWIDRLDEMRGPSIVASDVENAVKSILAWEDELRQKKQMET